MKRARFREGRQRVVEHELLQLVLEGAPVGDVTEGQHDAVDRFLTELVEADHLGLAPGPIGVPGTQLRRDTRARCLEALGEERPCRRLVLRVHDLEEGPTLHRGRQDAPVPFDGGAAPGDGPGRVEDRHRVLGILDEGAEPFLADPGLGQVAPDARREAALEPAECAPEQHEQGEAEEEYDRRQGKDGGVDPAEVVELGDRSLAMPIGARGDAGIDLGKDRYPRHRRRRQASGASDSPSSNASDQTDNAILALTPVRLPLGSRC